MPKSNNGPGRPRADDPKIHLPNVTINQSTIAAIKKISDDFPKMSLSEHYQKALDHYVEQYQTGITRLGYPNHK